MRTGGFERFFVRRRIRLPRTTHRDPCFFVTLATHARYPWFSRFPGLADDVAEILAVAALSRNTTLYSCCIMPDHVDLLVHDREVGDLLVHIKEMVALQAKHVRPGKTLWQPSYYDHRLKRDESLEQATAYILESPVRAGLVDHPTKYRWSGSTVWPGWRKLYW